TGCWWSGALECGRSAAGQGVLMPVTGLRPGPPCFGLDGLVLKRRTGWWWSGVWFSGGGPGGSGRAGAVSAPGPPGPRAPGPPGPRALAPRVGLDGLVLERRTGWWWSALVSSRRGPADPGRVSAGGVRRSGRGGEGPGPSGLAGRGRGRRGRFCGLDAAAPAALEEGPGAAGARG